MTLPVDKHALRRQARSRRRALTPEARALAAERVADTVLERSDREGWRRLAAYSALASELDLAPLFTRLGAGIELFLPAIDVAGAMAFRPWLPGQALESGPFGIAQPAASAPAQPASVLDAILLPLLGFDAAGSRLGSGAGFYDRALAGCRDRRTPPELVGVAFACQQFERLPRDPWDVPLHAVVTEQGWRTLPMAVPPTA